MPLSKLARTNTFEHGEEGIRQAEEMGLGNSLHPHQIVLQSATNILDFTYFIFSQCSRSALGMRIRIREGQRKTTNKQKEEKKNFMF
jgi:hypothetical protein